MRRFFDPADLIDTLGTPENVRSMSFGGATFDAVTGYFDSRAAAQETKNARTAEQISLARTLRDEARDSSLALSRTRALMAASGIGSDGVGVLAASAAETGRRAERLKIDSKFRQRQLSARASNQKRAGITQAVGSLVGGFVEGQSLYSRLKQE